ncbi:MAG TPA: TetR family transcriptional regulator [Caulobacteraceae bacterium]|jgi:AcrR family transcriptional regulator
MTAEPVERLRKRDSAATRAAILQAARRRFASEPFEQVGVRDVAAEAGVDAALIARYFGSKEDLFHAVVNDCPQASEAWAGDRATFGRRAAEKVASKGGPDGAFEGIFIALRSTASPRASEISREAMKRHMLEPLAQWLGGDDAEVRARLLLAYFMGGVVSRAMAPEDNATNQAMLDRLAEDMQRVVDGR